MRENSCKGVVSLWGTIFSFLWKFQWLNGTFSLKIHKFFTKIEIDYIFAIGTTTLIHSYFDFANFDPKECTLVWTYKKISVTIILREINPGSSGSSKTDIFIHSKIEKVHQKSNFIAMMAVFKTTSHGKSK